MSNSNSTPTISTNTDKKSPFGDIKPEDFKITNDDWSNLEETIFNIGSARGLKMDFVGSMLQTIQIDYSIRIPTACIQYVPSKKQFLIEINPIFFRFLTLEERMAVLLHEMEHMNKLHLTRIPAFEDRQKANKAADCAINQFIPGIPTRDPIKAIMPENFNLDKDRSLEDYYDMWPDDDEEEDNEDGGGGDGRGQLLDEHDWDPNVDEEDVLEGVEDVIKRTMIKTSRDHSSIPKQFQDLLENIEKKRKCIDWKKQLRQFIKCHASGIEKVATRNRPNKRYDYQSPGLKIGELPKLLILMDTSGSISVTEANAFLDQIDQILKVGMRDVKLGLWNTSCYELIPYRKGKRQEVHKKVKSGGTCFESCVSIINKTTYDGVIVLTDGFFDDTKTKVACPILFVISHGGAGKLPTSYPRQKMVKMTSMGE